MIGYRWLVYAGLAVALYSFGVFTGWKLTANAYEVEIAQRERDERAEADRMNRLAQRAAVRYEQQKKRRAAAVARMNKEIDDAIRAHREWADQPLPDGVRDAARRAAADPDPAQPDGNVPAVPAPGDANER